MIAKARLIQCGVRIGIVCGFLLLTASIVQAHGVSVFAWAEGDTVYVESKFSGGRRPKDSRIEVFDGTGNLLLKGLTNAQGEFSFKVPQQTEMKIVLTAGMGHRAEWTLTAADVAGLPETAPRPVAAAGPDAAGSDSPGSAASAMQPPAAPAETPAAPAVTAEALQQAIEAALDKKLNPVVKMLAESRQAGPSLRDVIGGIGYILGLVGLATFLRYRKKP